jgi:hypothetical protein
MSKQLVHVTPNLFLSSSTALIGSSAKLTNTELGKHIDSFENVVRFNRAVTKNFEKSVGEKTTLRVVNNHVFDNVDISDKGYSNSPKNFVKKLKRQNILYIGPHEGPWERRKNNSHKSNKLYKYEYSSIEKVKSILNIEQKENMQIGTIMIGLCILSGIKPHLFGFDLEDVPRTHYYQSRPVTENTINHNPSNERKALRKLVKNESISIN